MTISKRWLPPAVFFITTTLAVSAAIFFTSDRQYYFEGYVTLDERLERDANGFKHLRFEVFNAYSPLPQPFAIKEMMIDEDLKKDFHHFKITPKDIKILNPKVRRPDLFRLKVRLKRHGRFESVEPGDMYGITDDLKYGAKDVEVVINKKL